MNPVSDSGSAKPGGGETATPPAKKTATARPAAKKTAAKKAPAKKTATARPAAKKTAAKKAPAKKTATARPAAKKTAAKKASRRPDKVRGRAAQQASTRLGGFDFATWRTASDDPSMRSTMIGLMLMESTPDWLVLRDRFDRATRLAPILRSKVVEGPMGWESPRVVIDPHFDLDFHIRRFLMPAGSAWSDVLQEARRQSMSDFDKDRPLWQATIIDGLTGGRSAMILKLHHAIADGQGAVQIGAAVLDFAPEGQDLGPMPDAPEGVHLGSSGFVEAMVRDGVYRATSTAQDILSGIGPFAMEVLKDPAQALAKLRHTVESIARFSNTSLGPLSPIMQQRSINYHFDTIDVDFGEFKKSAKSRGRTVNDLFLAAISLSMFKYHERMGTSVTELRLNMPISLRTAADGAGNAVTIARFPIPVTNKIDHVLEQAASTVREWRAEPALRLADQLAEVSRFLPPEVLAAAAQSSDLTASNVPGLPIPVWLGGAKVERIYPLMATVGAAVNITMMTYSGVASVGISTDDAAVGDRAQLIACLRDGFAEATGMPVMGSDPLAVVAD